MPKTIICFDKNIYYYDKITKKIMFTEADKIPFRDIAVEDCPSGAVMLLIDNLAIAGEDLIDTNGRE